MIKYPKISVIIPTYNHEKYIGRCLRSVFDQSINEEDYEIIAIYHSHVLGDEEESDFDVKMSENCCLPFLIFSLNTQKINIYEPQNSDSDVNILERIKALA